MNSKVRIKNINAKGDYLLLIAVVLLSVVGTIFIYSASNYSALATYNNAFYFVNKQVLGILIGINYQLLIFNFTECLSDIFDKILGTFKTA